MESARLVRSIFVALSAVLLLAPMSARALDKDFQQWSVLNLEHTFENRIVAHLELQNRFEDDWGDVERIILRPTFSYKLTDEFSIGEGVGWQRKFPHPGGEEQFLDIYQFYTQFMYAHKGDEFSFQDRLRFEQNFVDNVDPMLHRARNRVRVTYPAPASLYAVSMDELFIYFNGNEKSVRSGFDQNRFFVGLGYKLSSQFSIESGYQLQSLNRHGVENRAIHIIPVFMNWQF